MSGTGRTRSRRREPAAEADSPPIEAAGAPSVDPGAELLDDTTVSIAGGRRGRSLSRSLPGAIAGTLLVVGLAFGAALAPGGALGPSSDREQAGTAAGDTGTAAGSEGAYGDGGSYQGDGDGAKDDAWGDGVEATTKPDESDGDHPDATEKPDAEPTEKPDAEPTPKPTEKPDAQPPAAAIALGLAIQEFHPFMEWGSCDGLDFDVYKVVRSTNSTVSWPLGEGDEFIAAVERGGARKAYDKNAPHGVKVWYRVFCVRKSEDGYKVVNTSVTKGIEVPEEPVPPPTPDPITLGLEVSPTDGGKVLLDWSECEVDGFAFYKVLRSTTTDDPSYLPWHDGTEVIGVIESMGVTQLELWAPDGDGTAWYRVQCIGYAGDQKVLLGESAVIAVTMP